ncbi:MAG: polymer-forming cytoskeletal protein [Anaerolineaceae bacterium]|nr:polymer-forming cytoskeletal protein [Anaerolineaceae bacterium]
MKKLIKVNLLVIVVVFIALALPTSAHAMQLSDRIVFGESYILGSNETLEGNLLLMGGIATLETSSIVSGDVTILGGVLEADGTIQGDLTVLGGTVTLKDHAILEGNLNAQAGYVSQSENAIIEGKFSETLERFPLNFLNKASSPLSGLKTNTWSTGLDLVWNIAKFLIQALVLSALSILMVLLMPKPVDTVINAMVTKPWSSVGYGFLTGFALPLIALILAVTILLAPISFLALVGFVLSILFGWLIVGFEIGNRLQIMFKAKWHPALSAGLGTLLLTLLAKGVSLIPCIGWILPFIVAVIGLGAVIVTIWGSKPYPRAGKEDKIEVIHEDVAQAPIEKIDVKKQRSSVKPASPVKESPSKPKNESAKK